MVSVREIKDLPFQVFPGRREQHLVFDLGRLWNIHNEYPTAIERTSMTIKTQDNATQHNTTQGNKDKDKDKKTQRKTKRNKPKRNKAKDKTKTKQRQDEDL
jgi:hypothetical protein